MSRTILEVHDLTESHTLADEDMADVRGGVLPLAGIAMTAIGAGMIGAGMLWPAGQKVELITPEVRDAGSVD